MKKKLQVAVLTASLVVGGMFSMATESSAALESPEVDETAIASKVVNQTKYYTKNQSVPSKISYNVGGWKGTLTLVSQQSTGDHIIAKYSGTVSCSGNCALPSKVKKSS